MIYMTQENVRKVEEMTSHAYDQFAAAMHSRQMAVVDDGRLDPIVRVELILRIQEEIKRMQRNMMTCDRVLEAMSKE